MQESMEELIRVAQTMRERGIESAGLDGTIVGRAVMPAMEVIGHINVGSASENDGA